MHRNYLSEAQCRNIRNLPREKGVHVYPPCNPQCPHLNVMKLVPCKGNPAGRNLLIGKVAEGEYLPLSEYRRLYDRFGKKRALPENPEKRKYTRRRPVSLKQRRGLEGVAGLPDDLPPEATVMKRGKDGSTVYVVIIRTTRDAGARKYSYEYLGRIKDGRFWTMDAYRAAFRRDGSPRKPE